MDKVARYKGMYIVFVATSYTPLPLPPCEPTIYTSSRNLVCCVVTSEITKYGCKLTACQFGNGL